MQDRGQPVVMQWWPSDQSLRECHRALSAKGTKRTSSNAFHHEIKVADVAKPTSDSHCLGWNPPGLRPGPGPWNQGQRQASRMSVSPGLTCLLAPPKMNGRVSTTCEVSLPVNTETSPMSQSRKGANSARLPPLSSTPTCTGSWDGSQEVWHLRAIQGSSGTRVDPPAPWDLSALELGIEISSVLK